MELFGTSHSRLFVCLYFFIQARNGSCSDVGSFSISSLLKLTSKPMSVLSVCHNRPLEVSLDGVPKTDMSESAILLVRTLLTLLCKLTELTLLTCVSITVDCRV